MKECLSNMEYGTVFIADGERWVYVPDFSFHGKTINAIQCDDNPRYGYFAPDSQVTLA